jgi:hypothetical protein
LVEGSQHSVSVDAQVFGHEEAPGKKRQKEKVYLVIILSEMKKRPAGSSKSSLSPSANLPFAGSSTGRCIGNTWISN